MKPTKTFCRSFLLLAGSSILAISSSHAATYYWDQNSTTSGFGTAGGTWDAVGSSTWNQTAAGDVGPIVSTTTTTSDIINFGNGATGLGAGTITVGTVSSGNMTFASGSGAIVLSGGSIALAASTTITVDNTINTIGSVLTGAGTKLTKAGSGTLVLTGISGSFTGPTDVTGGILEIGTGGRLGGTTYAGAIALTNSATYRHSSANSQTLSGAITGTSGSLVLNAATDLILSNGSNSYGSLTLTSNAGRVFIITNAGALPSAATVDINAGILVFNANTTNKASAITVASGGGIGARNVTTLTNVTLPGSGTVIFNNDDVTTTTLGISTNQTLAGALTVQVGGDRMQNTGSALGAVTLSGVISGGSGSLTMSSSGNTANTTNYGMGVLNLTNSNNDYGGGTILNQGTIALGTNGTLGATTGTLQVNNINNVASGRAVTLTLATSANTTVGSLSGTIATPTSGTNTATITTGSTGGARTFTVNQMTNGTYAGTIGGSGNFALGSLSNATLTLSGTNTYTGTTTVSAGTLLATKAAALPGYNAASKVSVASGATLAVNVDAGGWTSGQIDTLLGATPAAFTSGSKLGIEVTTGSFTYASDIGTTQIAKGLVKSGVGTLTLSGNNTYTGATNVTQGALVINGTTTSSSVAVSSGASLGGSGVMTGATVSGAGSINPGNSPGILTAAATNPTGGLDYNFEMTAVNTPPTWSTATASVNDVLRLTDATNPFTASLNSSNIISLYFGNGITPMVGDVFTGGFYTDKNADFLSTISSATFQYFVYNGVSGTPYNGTFYDVYTGTSITVSTFQVASANFAGGTVTNGYVTQFTVVPETSTALLSGLGALALLRRRRK